MNTRYLALDPVNGGPLALAGSVEEVQREVVRLGSRPEFVGLSVPVYQIEVVNGKAINPVKVAQIEAA